GAAQLDRQELQRVPGTGGDVVRALTVMPGVVNMQVPLGYAGVVIRGSSPQDSKVLVDGFEIPVLYHNIGFRAVLPAEAIDTLDYIPGGFDVGYGRASSGIVALTTRAGSERRSVADHRAELLRRPVPHRSSAQRQVAAVAVEPRHDRYVRAVRDEGHR